MSPSETSGAEQTEESSTPRPAGFLLAKFGLLILGGMLLLAAWNGWLVIVVLLGLALSAALITKLWSRFSLVNVHCQRSLSELRVFPDEHIDLKIRVVNSKLLPLPWMQVDDEIPVEFAPDIDLIPGSRSGFGFLSNATALLWYTGVSWQYRLHCTKRGYFQLGPMVISSGDIFGFYPRSITKPLIDHIIVYPKIFPIDQLGIPSLYPLGKTGSKRLIFEDPMRIVGVRDYSPHDSLKRIHWKASARHQNLQVKVFEPTTTLKVALFLAVDTFHHNGTHCEKDFELGISTAASIANHLTDLRSPVGLFVNSSQADSGQSVRMPVSGSSTQLIGILEALAKVTPLHGESFEIFLESERKGLPWGTTLVVVISRPSQYLTELLTNLRETGRKVLIIQIGDQGKNETVHNATWINVRHPRDLARISSEEAQ